MLSLSKHDSTPIPLRLPVDRFHLLRHRAAGFPYNSRMADPDAFRFSIDRGGTFTDIYAEVPGDPGYRVLKLLSENPGRYPDAPREGIRRILEEVTGTPHPESGFDTSRIEWVRMGTTVATNALLERKGARCALAITQGFGDLLRIGKQNRPRIFDLEIKKPGLLYEAVVEVDERVRLADTVPPEKNQRIAKGLSGETVAIVKEPNLDAIQPRLQELLRSGVTGLAVAFMHAYTYPEHEIAVGELAKKMGFQRVTLSHQAMPRIKWVDRGHTACVDAYLTPLLMQYLEGFESGLQGTSPPLFFMQSGGGLVRAQSFTGSRAILSGPAAGVVGMARTAHDAGSPVIGFDMGGTSTDVSRFDGEYEWVQETETAGVHLIVPQLDIRTVAAGGGSRLFFRHGLFAVGPESSGAHPGPVCYGKGGPLSLTDANLILGRLIPEHFPKVFGPDENQPLDENAARQEFERLTESVNAWMRGKNRPAMTVEEVAQGFIAVANETMARPIREISVLRGHDVKTHALASFGGAGGQHACAIARALGIKKIFIHRFAGVLSAYGLGLADVVAEKQEPANAALNKNTGPGLRKRLDALAVRAVDELKTQGDYPVEVHRYLNLRYTGSDTALMIAEPKDGDFAAAFEAVHRREFGFQLTGRDIVVDDLKVRAVGKAPPVRKIALAPKPAPTEPIAHSPCCFEGAWIEAPVYKLDSLGAGETLPGPAILLHQTSTILVEPHCEARVTGHGDVEIDVFPLEPEPAPANEDPVQLALFGNRFMSIAEQMGRTLQRTAISTNIKERQDYSCALFGPDGGLIANAPHQPVHLGAMGEAVRRQIEIQGKDMQPGDVWVTNHPVAGGSHLPDITVITPMILGGRAEFFAASRGHHADIGGITPGSMPPFSRTLAEEGACIESFKLVESGEFQEEGVTRLLTASQPGPAGKPVSGTRALKDNLSDLKAQTAANQKGIELLHELIEIHSLKQVQAMRVALKQHAAESVAAMLRQLSHSKGLEEVDTLEAMDRLDDGSPIRLRLTIDRRQGGAVFDFSGTGAEVKNNLNAPRAVTRSAILYCLRCLIDEDIPLNQGCLDRIEIVIPPGSLLSPSADAAVAGGNVLTSQRVTDVILKAFGAASDSQGCMNNLTFGSAAFGYYETIGGGAGAGPHWHGQSGVHTHMTNTRITDPEIVERRYPVLLKAFSIRAGSGGAGRFRGGDGLIREIEFLQPLEVAILSERRWFAPQGLEGGGSGMPGLNLWLKRDGGFEDLGGRNAFTARPGDRIRILTPGGGGWGAAGPAKKR